MVYVNSPKKRGSSFSRHDREPMLGSTDREHSVLGQMSGLGSAHKRNSGVSILIFDVTGRLFWSRLEVETTGQAQQIFTVIPAHEFQHSRPYLDPRPSEHSLKTQSLTS